MAETPRCYHCNNVVPRFVDLTIKVGDACYPVCCLGCQAVAQLILAGGFDQFYKFRSNNLSIPEQPGSEDEELLALFDRPETLRKIAQPVTAGASAPQTPKPNPTKAFTADSQPVTDPASAKKTNTEEASATYRIELAIDGITCAACVWLIEQFVRQLAGVNEFWVNLTTHRAELVWQQSTTQLSRIFRAIQQLGFKVYPFSPDAEEKRLNAQQKTHLIRLGVAGIGMMQNMMFALPLYFGIDVDSDQFVGFFRYVSLLVACPVLFYSARPFFSAALRDLKVRHLTMDVPVALAIGGAFTASTWVTLFGGEEVYFDSVCMFTFFLLLGRYLEASARSRSARSQAQIRSSDPGFVRRVKPSHVVDNNIDSQFESTTVNHNANDQSHGQLIACDELKPGDWIEIKPGTLIPVDGIIRSGTTEINEAALTGEFLPQPRKPGEQVLSGSVNIEDKILVEVTAIGAQSHLSTINRLVDRALNERPRIAALADRVASFFVAGVLIIATIVAFSWWQIAPEHAFTITLAVLVVTCPCALSLATPTALTVATTALREAGFIITRGQVLETLASIDHFVFDKTGTLTRGELSIEKITNVSDLHEDELTAIAAALEADSHHPIARLFKALKGTTKKITATQIHHKTGYGVEATINGASYRLGRADFAVGGKPSVSTDQEQALQREGNLQPLYLSKDKLLLCIFHLSDRLRPSAPAVINYLTDRPMTITILSGDTSAMVEHTANTLGIRHFHKGLSPQQKLEQVKALQQSGDSIAMVGDGINDVPVMAGAHLSIAMNNASDLTRLKADAIILNGDLNTLSYACEKARQTYRIIRQNVIWSITYNLTALPLAALGYVPPYAAAIGMSASSLLVVLNALRLKKAPAQPSLPREETPTAVMATR